MEGKFVSIEYIQLAPDVLVPMSWPIYGMESFVLKAIRRIIETSQQDNPVIQINKISAQLIRNHLGYPFVFVLVPEAQIVEDDVFELVSHIDENNNEIEIISGSNPGSSDTCWAKIREPVCLLRSRLIK